MKSPVRSSPFRTLRVIAGLAAFCGLCGSGALAQSTDEDNPFRPAGTTAVASAPASDAELDALQFSGLWTIGSERSFNFTDSRTRKSFWVPLNGTENGITVVSYDDANEQVVVRRGAVQRPFALRKAVLVAAPSGPMSTAKPGSTPVAARPAGSGVDEIKNPKTPAEIKQAEYEARMLVSDLLDISMKAREEQRKLREAQQAQAGASAPR